jgi:multidrug efflux pump subunit AcrB
MSNLAPSDTSRIAIVIAIAFALIAVACCVAAAVIQQPEFSVPLVVLAVILLGGSGAFIGTAIRKRS